MRVRVIDTIKKSGSAAKMPARYLARTAKLTFDPGRWQWRPGDAIYAYTARSGRHWHSPREELSLPIHQKWIGLVFTTFAPNWMDVWRIGRPRKEAAFLWSLYHRAIAVNQWRRVASTTTSDLCTCCNRAVPESLIHAFYECEAASAAWEYATTVLYLMLEVQFDTIQRPRLTWQQCVLGYDLPAHLQSGRTVWSLIRGSVLWVIWIRRNASVFKDVQWPKEQLQCALWDSFLNLGRLAWLRVRMLERLQPVAGATASQIFENRWASSPTVCSMIQGKPRWNHVRPPCGVFY